MLTGLVNKHSVSFTLLCACASRCGPNGATRTGLVRCVIVDKRQRMRASPVITVLQVLTWCCVILLAILSLLPGEGLAALSLLPIMKMVRTVLPAPLEHFIAYAGVAAIAMTGYGSSIRCLTFPPSRSPILRATRCGS